jgi:curved DNA-binding protein CbpA
MKADGFKSNGQDYYAILGITADASQKTVRDAYRALAFKLHPDRNPNDPQAAEKFRSLHEAYKVLGNPEARRAYDKGYDVSSLVVKNARKNVRAALRAFWRARYGLPDEE